MDISQFNNSKYLAKSDVKPPLIATVDYAIAENVGQPAKLKLVVHFKEAEKGLVCNRINREILAEISGSSETDDWPGTKVQLYFKPDVEFGGKRVGGIRIQEIPGQPVQEREFDAAIPFGDDAQPAPAVEANQENEAAAT